MNLFKPVVKELQVKLISSDGRYVVLDIGDEIVILHDNDKFRITYQPVLKLPWRKTRSVSH